MFSTFTFFVMLKKNLHRYIQENSPSEGSFTQQRCHSSQRLLHTFQHSHQPPHMTELNRLLPFAALRCHRQSPLSLVAKAVDVVFISA